MTQRESPIDEVLEAARAALNARRAALLQRVSRVANALEAYQRAAEAEIARSFANEHGLARPTAAALSSERAAELLEAAVQALPELSGRQPASVQPASTPTGALSAPGEGSEPHHVEERHRFPLLTQAVVHARIVVIGALSGRDRSPGLPPELGSHVEWIDTERDGAHAVGNLPQRVRQGRVAGVVILDRVVQHRHTEPVVAAARDAGVPIAFAGQGGKASFLRALEQLETTLASRP